MRFSTVYLLPALIGAVVAVPAPQDNGDASTPAASAPVASDSIGASGAPGSAAPNSTLTIPTPSGGLNGTDGGGGLNGTATTSGGIPLPTVSQPSSTFNSEDIVALGPAEALRIIAEVAILLRSEVVGSTSSGGVTPSLNETSSLPSGTPVSAPGASTPPVPSAPAATSADPTDAAPGGEGGQTSEPAAASTSA